MNKKGFAVEDALTFMILALVFVFVLIFVILIVGKFNDGIQGLDYENNTNLHNITATISQDYTTKFNRADTGIAVLLFGFLIASVIVARRLEEIKPVWIFAGILGVIVIGFIAMIFENIWGEFNSQADIASTTSNFTFIPFIMDNLVVVVIFYVAIVTIARLTRDDMGGFRG